MDSFQVPLKTQMFAEQWGEVCLDTMLDFVQTAHFDIIVWTYVAFDIGKVRSTMFWWTNQKRFMCASFDIWSV